MLTRDEIGRRAARETGAGMVVDLGTGPPTPAANSVRLELGAMVRLAPGADVEEGRAGTGATLRAGPRPGVADVGADPAPATEGGRI